MHVDEPGDEPEPNITSIWSNAATAVATATAAVAAAEVAEAAARLTAAVTAAEYASVVQTPLWSTFEEEPIPDWAAATTEPVEIATGHSEPEIELEPATNDGGSESSGSRSLEAHPPGCTCAVHRMASAFAAANRDGLQGAPGFHIGPHAASSAMRDRI